MKKTFRPWLLIPVIGFGLLAVSTIAATAAEEVLFPGLHPFWVSMEQAFTKQQALLPSDLGLPTEELVSLPGRHPTWVSKLKLFPEEETGLLPRVSTTLKER